MIEGGRVAWAWLAVLLASASLATCRMSWPEVVGMSSAEAKKVICGDRPCGHVRVIPPGVLVTMEYLGWRRVRVFVDSNDKVVSIPRIG